MTLTRKQKLFVRDECLTLWKDLFHTGSFSKRKIIKLLYQEGQLSKAIYKNSCPFCSAFMIESEITGRTNCENCIWPGYKAYKYRCEKNKKSPYFKWRKSRNIITKRFWAWRVYRLVKKIEI